MVLVFSELTRFSRNDSRPDESYPGAEATIVADSIWPIVALLDLEWSRTAQSFQTAAVLFVVSAIGGGLVNLRWPNNDNRESGTTRRRSLRALHRSPQCVTGDQNDGGQTPSPSSRPDRPSGLLLDACALRHRLTDTLPRAAVVGDRTGDVVVRQTDASIHKRRGVPATARRRARASRFRAAPSASHIQRSHRPPGYARHLSCRLADSMLI